MESIQVLNEQEIDFVRNLAKSAGLRAKNMRNGVSVEEKSGPGDLVTSADLELSKYIVSELSSRFANDVIISEEDNSHPDSITNNRVWLVDPIDGTKNYIKRNGQYSVMIGLLLDKKPVFGFVYEAEYGKMYYGGPQYGAFLSLDNGASQKVSYDHKLNSEEKTRVIMGNSDRKKNAWIENLECVEIIKTGSIGLKVARILDNKADVLVHLSGKLKAWDTAGPAAIALGGNLEIGTFGGSGIEYKLPNLLHSHEVFIGRAGCLNWCKRKLVSP